MKLNVSLLMAVYITNNYNYDSYSQNLSYIILILILYNITYKYQLNTNGAACYAKGIVKYRFFFFEMEHEYYCISHIVHDYSLRIFSFLIFLIDFLINKNGGRGIRY